MLQAFREGGFGMIPTLVFGLFLLAVSVRYAAKPEPRQLPLLLSLAALTLLSGALGFVMGLITVARVAGPIQEAEWRSIMVVGFGEALQNVAFSLVLSVLSAIAAAVGAWRASRGGQVEASPAR